jgi:predicted ATPase
LGDVPELFPALYGRFMAHFARGELGTAYEVAWELRRLGEERRDAAAWAAGHRIVGSTLHYLGRLADSRAHLEAGLALYDPDRDRGSAFVYAVDSGVVCSFWLAHVLFALGYPEQAWTRMKEALAAARALVHPYTLAYTQIVACILYGRHPPNPEVRTETDALVAFATEQGFPLAAAVGTVASGWALTGEDEASVEDGIARMCRGVAAYKATGAELWMPDFLSLLAQAHARAGRPGVGLELLAEALVRVEGNGARWLEAELHRLRGELLLALAGPDRGPEAEACFGRALTIAREQAAKMWELRAATSLVRLWAGRGRRQEARNLLAPICGWFAEGCDAPDLQDAKELLDVLR